MTTADPRRRAPRLAPEQRIAPHITRVGRFRKLDPARGRPPPGLARVLGAVVWAVLVEEAYRRAVRATRD